MKKDYEQLLDYVHRAVEYLQLTANGLNDLLGESEAADELAAWRRSKFTITENRDFWQNGGRALPDGEQQSTKAEAIASAESEKQSKWGILTFTEKEIIKMPIEFKKQYRAGKITAHVRRRENGIYEIRCQIKKHPISASSKNLQEAKRKFTAKVTDFWNSFSPIAQPKKSITLGEYMLQWLNTVKKPFVKPITYKDYLLSYRANIRPVFGNRVIGGITQFELQAFINSYVEQGKNRTALKLYQMLTALFEYAAIDDLVKKSPMQKVILPRYEQKSGISLTREEEKKLVNLLLTEGDTYAQAFVFLIYTGLRRSELVTVTIADGWITLITAKTRKGYKEKVRSIPIPPMLAPLLPRIDVEAIKEIPVALLTKYFKKWFPDHHLHDTRHTFITRAQECGIPREMVSLWAGHAADSSTTTTVYTHLGQNKEIQLKEMQKFIYDL